MAAKATMFCKVDMAGTSMSSVAAMVRILLTTRERFHLDLWKQASTFFSLLVIFRATILSWFEREPAKT